MYLSCKKYLSKYDIDSKGKIDKIKEIFSNGLEPEEVSFDAFSWRKANAIHKWFVDNVQEGNDDCKSYDVLIEKLKELLDAINKVLGVTDKEKLANKIGGYENDILPTTSGFFFGGAAYDEYYVSELERTKEFLEGIFNNPSKWQGYSFEYTSSW